MKYLLGLLLLVPLATTALAADAPIPTHSRHVEWQVMEPCGLEVAAGEVMLEWASCGGDYELLSLEVAGADHPISLLFMVGCPDFSEMDEHAYQSFFCNPCCTCKKPDIYCGDCNPCGWYCYKTRLDKCCEPITVYAYLPCCMALEITDLW